MNVQHKLQKDMNASTICHLDNIKDRLLLYSIVYLSKNNVQNRYHFF